MPSKVLENMVPKGCLYFFNPVNHMNTKRYLIASKKALQGLLILGLAAGMASCAPGVANRVDRRDDRDDRRDYRQDGRQDYRYDRRSDRLDRVYN